MKPLLFLHIPRTGGTSLISWLDGQFDKEDICPAHEMFEFEELEKSKKMLGYSFYRGHFGINFADRLREDAIIITFLRKPIDRAYSTWSHLRNTEIPFVGNESKTMVQQIQTDTRLAKALDFEEFCHEIMGQGRLSFFNQMTVLLGLGRGWEVAQTGIPVVDDALFDTAKENLRHLSFVGFTETYQADFAELTFMLSKEIALVPHVNASPDQRHQFSEEFSNWLQHATRFDQRLYELARHCRPQYTSVGGIDDTRRINEVGPRQESAVYDLGSQMTSAAEPMLVQIVGAINIVMYRGMYYALPQNLGAIDLHKESVVGLPGVRVAGSLAGILSIIGQS